MENPRNLRLEVIPSEKMLGCRNTRDLLAVMNLIRDIRVLQHKPGSDSAHELRASAEASDKISSDTDNLPLVCVTEEDDKQEDFWRVIAAFEEPEVEQLIEAVKLTGGYLMDYETDGQQFPEIALVKTNHSVPK